MILRGMLWGFNLLYHQLAWIYDFAAWLVSAGRWNDWIRSAGELVTTGPVLDIGCGQGLMLEFLTRSNYFPVGLDESPQMLLRCQKRLAPVYLIRGLGQALPFSDQSFQTITATFPAPYLFEPATMHEVHRILARDGTFIILLTAECTGTSLHERLIRLTGKLIGFSQLSEVAKSRLLSIFHESGFDAKLMVKVEISSRLYLIQARRSSPKRNL
jgi:ubiquinone/menaquinone biosynthesis C-methylase UbiE